MTLFGVLCVVSIIEGEVGVLYEYLLDFFLSVGDREAFRRFLRHKVSSRCVEFLFLSFFGKIFFIDFALTFYHRFYHSPSLRPYQKELC